MSVTRNGNESDLQDRPIGELLKQLADETSTLVRQELELAKAELTEKGKSAGVGVGMFGAAGVIGFLALACLTATFVLALNLVMPAWLAALIVAIVYGAGAAALGLFGKEKVAEAAPPAPEQTIDSVKEDARWAKTQMKSGMK